MKSMNVTLRNSLLATVAGVALTTFAGAASAQVQQPGFFGSLTGWYYPWKDTGSTLRAFDTDDEANAGKVKTPGNGFGGRAYLGFQFYTPFDIAVGAQGSWLSKGKVLSADLDDEDSSRRSGTVDTLRQKADYWLGDVEIGYTFKGGLFALRPFLGARYAQFDNRAYGTEDDGGDLELKTRFRGIGPRAGIDGAFRFAPDSAFSVMASASGGPLFGHVKANAKTDDSADKASEKVSRTVWNAEGQVALGYDIAPNVTLAAGYRGEWWKGAVYKQFEMDYAPDFSESGGKGNRFMHGPFVRLSYNIGAPRGVTPAAAVAPAPAPAAAPKKNFLVFFDFDRSNITADAQRVITEAAAAAKAGNVSRIQLTGHTDRSGSDQYNMALSLRRGEAVKQALIRQGIPAASIAVIGRGESQPLVPTADGVREPQNRRVEILL